MYNKCCDDWDKGPDCDEKKECNIKSECCKGFVKRQFSITATATPGNGTEVYENTDNFRITGTVLLTNLGSKTITFIVDGKEKTVLPNRIAAITATNIDHVTIRTQQGTSRALLCFDIQVPSPEYDS